jgi:hypothetical protein
MLGSHVRIGMQAIAGEAGTLESKIKSFLENALKNLTRFGSLERGNHPATHPAAIAGGLMLGQLHFPATAFLGFSLLTAIYIAQMKQSRPQSAVICI